MRMLIIEDEILILKALKRIFEKYSFIVDTTTMGSEAIELIRQRNYNCILCDLMLQDITGFDVIESCKNLIQHKKISDYFIIMTAYSSSKILEQAKRYDCTIIEKPFEDIDLIAKKILKKVVSQNSQTEKQTQSETQA